MQRVLMWKKKKERGSMRILIRNISPQQYDKLSFFMKPNVTLQFCGLSVKYKNYTADWSLF